MKNKDWHFTGVRIGNVAELKQPLRSTYCYIDILKRLTKTEKPHMLVYKLEPNSFEMAKRARKNIQQWFHRNLGAFYVSAHVRKDESGVWFVAVFRGKKWYDPKLAKDDIIALIA